MKSIFHYLMALFILAGVLNAAPAAAEPAMSQNHMAKTNQFWWPELIDLSPLRQHARESSPMDDAYNYRQEFEKIDLAQLKKEIEEVMKTSQPWWPADYGHYGPFFIRMAWHSAGTYRVTDGRGGAGGGQQRFEPLNSWPDNANLDKARRLLWPIKKKYGQSLSWADLMVLTGNVALESMGFETMGFAGGRTDDWEPDLVYWGPETKMMGSDRHISKSERTLEKPLGATHMGLIYVNPEGPDGKPDPKLAAKDIREAFGRMAMNDEETVALIAGGHTFGKNHGAVKTDCLGDAPAGEAIEAQGFGWKNRCGKGNAEDTTTSGLEGAWTATPTQWSMQYLETLFAFDWKLTQSPAGAKQWIPKDKNAANLVPDAHIKGKRHAPVMLTTDLSLKMDPQYREISQRFLKNPEAFEQAFARAWFKLTHRDMGPRSRYVGDEAPEVVLLWQDPIPTVDYKTVGKRDIKKLKKQILESDLSISQLVRTAWASAASFRSTDMRGGANGARIRLAPQKNWAVNHPQELEKVLAELEKIQKDFNGGSKKISMADLIVLGGSAAVEQTAKNAGFDVTVPFKPGRADASQAQTDVSSFEPLEPKADGFRNYYGPDATQSPTFLLVDRASKLDLTVPEMTVLIGGLRTLGANTGGVTHGVFTQNTDHLTNDFFVNLLDMSTTWEKSKDKTGIYVGKDRATNKTRWTATPVDLAFGSSSELRAVSEVYASDDAQEKFVNDFVDAWTKVMTLDRFDLM